MRRLTRYVRNGMYGVWVDTGNGAIVVGIVEAVCVIFEEAETSDTTVFSEESG